MDIIAYRLRIRHVEVYIQIHRCLTLTSLNNFFLQDGGITNPYTTIEIKINDSKIIWHTACHIVGVQ